MRKCLPPLLLIKKKKKLKKPHCNFGIFLAQQFSLSQVLILYMGPWKQLKLYNFGKRQKMNIYLSSSLFSQWRIHNRPLHRYRNCNNLLKRVQTSCPFLQWRIHVQHPSPASHHHHLENKLLWLLVIILTHKIFYYLTHSVCVT